jgi:pimeloyl-ACP methyl ester carboxylesterase
MIPTRHNKQGRVFVLGIVLLTALRQRVARDCDRERVWLGCRTAQRHLAAVLFVSCALLQCLPLAADQSHNDSPAFPLDTRWQAGVGLADSLSFPLDTRWQTHIGVSDSPLFALDTRADRGLAAANSRLFILDTRVSTSLASADSRDFTLDTRAALVPSVVLSGRVESTTGGSLSGATVSALFYGRVRATALTDGSGHYVLPLLPPGFYELRAAKTDYLTAWRRGLPFAAGQTGVFVFSLTPRPASPSTQAVVRVPEPTQNPPLPPTTNQLKVWVSNTWTTNVHLDPTKMTIVLTHGWNSSYSDWPAAVASNLVSGPGNIASMANIVAWDWESQAQSPYTQLSLAFSRTPAQAEALGTALFDSLGVGYDKPIHFLGHSLGTLVNAGAADYLHSKASRPYAWQRTHMTLLDNAARANWAGPLEDALVAGLRAGLQAAPEALLTGNAAPIGEAALESVIESALNSGIDLLQHGIIAAVPEQSAWRDNYVSLVGANNNSSVNVCLEEGPFFTHSFNPVTLHSYAIDWYGRTVAKPDLCFVGHTNSFERLGFDADLVNHPPVATGNQLRQKSRTAEFLVGPNTEDASVCALQIVRNVTGAAVTCALSAPCRQQVGDAAVRFVGRVVVNQVEKVKNKVVDFVESIFGGGANMGQPVTLSGSEAAWFLQVVLNSAPAVIGQGFQPAGGGGPTNTPAYAWLDVVIPSNAVALSFDFQFHGEGSNDCLVFGINGTNQFALELRFMPQDTQLDSGGIDLSPWAGQQVELFFGVMGGTSTNATLTIDGIRFYEAVAPIVQAQPSGNQLVVSWPYSALDYHLESTPALGPTNQWTSITNNVGLEDFMFSVTNTMSDASRFYRLRKP